MFKRDVLIETQRKAFDYLHQDPDNIFIALQNQIIKENDSLVVRDYFKTRVVQDLISVSHHGLYHVNITSLFDAALGHKYNYSLIKRCFNQNYLGMHRYRGIWPHSNDPRSRPDYPKHINILHKIRYMNGKCRLYISPFDLSICFHLYRRSIVWIENLKSPIKNTYAPFIHKLHYEALSNLLDHLIPPLVSMVCDYWVSEDET